MQCLNGLVPRILRIPALALSLLSYYGRPRDYDTRSPSTNTSHCSGLADAHAHAEIDVSVETSVLGIMSAVERQVTNSKPSGSTSVSRESVLHGLRQA